jgi:hypothetical protein
MIFSNVSVSLALLYVIKFQAYEVLVTIFRQLVGLFCPLNSESNQAIIAYAMCTRSSVDRAVVSGTTSAGGSNPFGCAIHT